jgi:hypothetical protein
VHNFLE